MHLTIGPTGSCGAGRGAFRGVPGDVKAAPEHHQMTATPNARRPRPEGQARGQDRLLLMTTNATAPSPTSGSRSARPTCSSKRDHLVNVSLEYGPVGASAPRVLPADRLWVATI